MEFTETPPDDGCACPGCGARRRARLHAARTEDGGHRAARGARRAAVLLATVTTVLGGAAGAGTATARAPGDSSGQIPDAPQGEVSGLYGAQSLGTRLRAATPATTRAEVMARAERWLARHVPYSMTSYWSDGYRQDCSGFVSMAWGLGSSQTTWTLPDFADRIAPAELQPGDVLLHNNPADPGGGSHAVLFGGWTDATHTRYTAYEQTRPATLTRATPYAYWNNSGSYLPYRYRGLNTPAPAPAPTPAPAPAPADPDAFPGSGAFGPGKSNARVQRLGELLVRRGGGRFYQVGPGPAWGEADRRATEAFQLAQGWRGTEADGYPGQDTWDRLVHGTGQDIPPATAPAPPPATPPTPAVPPFPGPAAFGPGQVNGYVQQLGEQLVRKGFGHYYTVGPSPDWGEADRLGTQAFQLAQGWRGTEADGYPGQDTWRLLFG